MKKIIVLAPSFVLIPLSGLVPALASIAEAFPSVDQTAVQMLVTLPPLVAVPFILLSGFASNYTTKKDITLCSLLVMLAGGLFPFFFHQSFACLLVGSVLLGAGLGGVSPMTITLVHEHYPGDTVLLGCTGAVLSIGGMLFSFVSGWLASFHWRFAYLTFLLMIPVFILAVFLPKGAVVKSKERYRALRKGSFGFYLVQGIISSIAFNTFNANIAMYIEGAALGGSLVSGNVTAIYSAIGIVGGITTGRFIKRFKKYALTILFLCAAAGMLCIFFADSLLLVSAGTVMVGFSFSVFMPAGYNRVTQSVPAIAAAIGISLYCAACQLGQFLNPFIINPLAALVGKGLDMRFLLSSIVLASMFVVTCIREWRASIPGRIDNLPSAGKAG